MDLLAVALEQLQRGRSYTLGLLDDVPASEWFRMPAEGVTHIGWQVGHLAFAEYVLCLRRIRGERAEDHTLIPTEYLTLFGRESRPVPGAEAYPAPDKLREVLDRVHAQLLRELPQLSPDEWQQPPEFQPHRIAQTKLELIQWCARHELIHAGQIALLRRLLGHAPQW